MFLSPASRARPRVVLPDLLGNMTLSASVASNILTIAVTPTRPAVLSFRDAGSTLGDQVRVPFEALLSINTNAAGATLASVNGVPFRLWILAFNNAGATVLALWQSVTGGGSPAAIATLNEAALQSTTAISGAATSAGVFYTPNGTTLTNKAFRILGYVEYASGLATAGTYNIAPTTVQVFGPGIKKPGDAVQCKFATNNTPVAASSTTQVQTSLSLSITPTSAMNLVRVMATGPLASQTVNQAALAQLSRGTAPTLIGNIIDMVQGVGAGLTEGGATLLAFDAPQTTAATTYVVFLSGTAAGTYNWNRSASFSSAIEAQEIMV